MLAHGIVRPVPSLPSRDPKAALLARVFAASTGVALAATTLLALTPLTLGWPLTGKEVVEFAAWALGLSFANYIVLRASFARSRVVQSRARTRHADLTLRETEIVRMIAEGYTAKEIAGILFISPKTVDAHRGHILQKLGLRDRVALTKYAIRQGLVDP
jgi:DNA-binding CsgD family transcriptional regulator